MHCIIVILSWFLSICGWRGFVSMAFFDIMYEVCVDHVRVSTVKVGGSTLMGTGLPGYSTCRKYACHVANTASIYVDGIGGRNVRGYGYIPVFGRGA